jgi:hypothetical protein
MAKSKFNTEQIQQKCLSTKAITFGGGSIIDNSDGSVSVYMAYGPVILTKECCEKLSPNYSFDENTQKCMWAEPINCAINNTYKLTLNPINNDGAFFNVGDKETCTLNVEFDYLFKTSCKTLTNLLTNTNSVSFVSSETKGKINQLENDIADQEVLCETISGQIITLQTQIENTPYSIVCEVEYTTQPSLGSIPTSTTQSYQNTGFNSTPTAPIDATGSQYSQTQNITGTYCLTETGLSAFETILGIRYTAFINGDPTSYTCDDVTALLDQNTPTNPLVLETCDVPFGFKNQLINDLANLQTQLTNCDSILSQLNNELNTLNANIPLIESACNKPIDFFETLDVSMTVDVISGNTLTTVYEAFDLFSAIGSGNLYKYLSENPNSGFFVSDENGQALKLYSTYVGDCKQIPSLLNNDLMAEAGSITPQEFKNTISDDAFASNWLTYSTTITDPDIIALIADKKIKISLKINNTCGDVCILLDNIKINKDCTKVTKTNIFVTECPGFEIERIRDNKKSWINNTTLVNRDFKILNTYGDNTIRQTNYNTEDERLILNSKEIDLDINLGAAIETDVWNYVVDNPCILTGETNCFIVFSGCGAGFTATTSGCQKITYTAATVNPTTYTVNSGNTNSAYGSSGGIVYENITNLDFPITAQTYSFPTPPLVDSTGHTLTYTSAGTNQLWGTGSASDGRLNTIGIWGASVPTFEWVGFSYCVNLPNTQIYTLGYAVDDVGRIYVDGELILELISNGNHFRAWKLFPITLSAGEHVIEFYAQNYLGGASLGAEIYSADTSVISGFTATTQLNPYIVFSTGNLIGQQWQLGENSGFSCPSGYAFDLCAGGLCAKIETTSFSSETSDASCISCYCTGDNKIDFNSLVTQPLSAITVFEDFQYYLTSELIDVKNRQTINSYPTLRALYDRYLSSTAYCDTISSAFDYQTMDRFAGLVGNYWVDIVEQVIPATTIWGSVKVYSNTIFDTQKFKYKSYTTFFCDNPFSGETVPSPINGTSGATQTVGIEYDIISGNMPTWLTFGGEQGKCGEIKIAQMNFGSEFIGVVSELTTNKITSGKVVNLSSE